MMSESFMIRCLRRSREQGEAIVMADQSISSLKEVAKSNVYTILCLSQSGQKDRREVVSVLGLNPQQADVTNRLKEGEGILRMASRHPYPVLLKFPLVEVRNISDQEIDEINQNDERIQGLLSQVVPRHQPEEGICQEEKTQEMEVSPEVLDMLRDMYHRFDVASSQRAKDLGLCSDVANRQYKLIEKEQWADAIKVNLSGKKGGLAKYHCINSKGCEVIDKPPIKQSGGTGPLHGFIQRYLCKHLKERGFSELAAEKNIGGKHIDVFGIYEDLRIGIEICCSTYRTEHENIQKDWGACDRIVVVTPDKKAKEKVTKQLSERIEPKEKVKVCLVSELLNNTDEIVI